MAEDSNISWTDDTFNPWIGCTRISPACDACYAAAMMGTEGRMKVAEWGGPGKGAGTRVRTSKANWSKPRTWDRKVEARKASWDAMPLAQRRGPRPTNRFVFCASLADVFDNEVPAQWRRDLFNLIQDTPNLTWLLLTKRPGNIERLFREAYGAGLFASEDVWPRNAAIGCTVVNQAEAERDVQKLLLAKSTLRPAFAFLSMEPLLETVDLTKIRRFPGGKADKEFMDALRGTYWRDPTGLPNPDPRWSRPGMPFNQDYDYFGGIDWVITGGETSQGGHKARHVDEDAFRSLRDQCAAAGVPFHLKQMVGKAPIPADLQIQERPQ